MTQKTRPSLIARILTPVVILLIMLVLVELFLQFFMPVPFSDRLYWVPDGHVKARLEPHQPVVNTDGNTVRINHLGFRGPDWSWEAPPGTLRLIVMGGSSAFCYQVSDDAHTWPAQLQELLVKRLKMPVEVINLGLPGYDLSNSKINYLFSGRALNPHVALIYHTWNDMKFFRVIDKTEGTPRVVLSGRVSGDNPLLITRILRRLQIVQRTYLILKKMKRRDVENRYTSLEREGERAHAPVGESAWSWFEQNFEDASNVAKADGVLPVLISQGSLVNPDSIGVKESRLVIANDMQGMTLPRLTQSWLQANQVIERVATQTGAVFVNGYDAVPHDLDHFKDHVHLWDLGSLRLAEAIAESLLAEPRFLETAERIRVKN